MDPEEALVAVPGACLSHESAARKHGIELVDDTGIQRITVPRNHSGLLLAGWKVHRADVTAEEREAGVTALPRTVSDLGRVLPLEHAVASADSSLRKKLVTEAVLLHVLTSTRGRGAPQLRLLATLLDAKSGSVLESLFRVLVLRASLPAPKSQYLIYDRDDFIARVDFCWVAQRLIVELDGFAFHSDRAAYRRDRQLLNDLERLGWRVLRFTWEDVVGRPLHVLGLLTQCLL